MHRPVLPLLAAWAASAAAGGPSIRAEQPISTWLLILDLEGDGLFLSDRSYPVSFDADSDGTWESLAWPALGRNEAFLWIDGWGGGELDGAVDDGRELVGTRSLPGGGEAGAFEVLGGFDGRGAGGDGDGALTPADRIWPHLRLWIDRDRDGASSAAEVVPLSAWRISEIPLSWREEPRLDGNLNRIRAVGAFRIAPRGRRGGGGREGAIYEVELARAEGP